MLKILLSLLFLHSVISGSTHMETTKKQFFIGIPIRTSNALFLQEAPALWDKFYKENVSEKIPNRLNQNLIALYTDYESDYTKPYTYLLGCLVSSLDKIPDGMRGIEIPASPYTVFDVKGEFPESMMDAWKNIWSSSMKRSYTIDYEVYPSNFNPQGKPEIKIYIALH